MGLGQAVERETSLEGGRIVNRRLRFPRPQTVVAPVIDRGCPSTRYGSESLRQGRRVEPVPLVGPGHLRTGPRSSKGVIPSTSRKMGMKGATPFMPNARLYE